MLRSSPNVINMNNLSGKLLKEDEDLTDAMSKYMSKPEIISFITASNKEIRYGQQADMVMCMHYPVAEWLLEKVNSNQRMTRETDKNMTTEGVAKWMWI